MKFMREQKVCSISLLFFLTPCHVIGRNAVKAGLRSDLPGRKDLKICLHLLCNQV